MREGDRSGVKETFRRRIRDEGTLFATVCSSSSDPWMVSSIGAFTRKTLEAEEEDKCNRNTESGELDKERVMGGSGGLASVKIVAEVGRVSVVVGRKEGA